MNKYYLAVVFSVNCLFAAEMAPKEMRELALSEKIALVQLSKEDSKTITDISGYDLTGLYEDEQYREKDHTKYKANSGDIIIHTYSNKKYDVAELADQLSVTQIFYAVTTGAEHQIFGFNVISVGKVYNLIVSRKNSGAWLINAIAADSSDSASEGVITKFCTTKFKAVPVFSQK